MNKANFIQLLIDGKELETSIDEYVEKWHNGSSLEELHEFLGMTPNEYALWVENPATLRSIVFQRKYNTTLPQNDWTEVHQLAARSAGLGEFTTQQLMNWLRERSYL